MTLKISKASSEQPPKDGPGVVPPVAENSAEKQMPSAQDVVEGRTSTKPTTVAPPDLRSETSSNLNNASATPGTGILPVLDDDDPNMQPSG